MVRFVLNFLETYENFDFDSRDCVVRLAVDHATSSLEHPAALTATPEASPQLLHFTLVSVDVDTIFLTAFSPAVSISFSCTETKGKFEAHFRRKMYRWMRISCRSSFGSKVKCLAYWFNRYLQEHSMSDIFRWSQTNARPLAAIFETKLSFSRANSKSCRSTPKCMSK